MAFTGFSAVARVGWRLLPAGWRRHGRTLHEKWKRRSGRRRLISHLRAGDGRRIVVGASGVCAAGWIPTEIEYLNLLHAEDWAFFFERDSLDAILAEHVWEHLSPEEGLAAARTCHDYLAPGGHLRVAVPDGFNPDPTYREHVRPGGDGPGADDHKVLYNFQSLGEMLARAGFRTEPLEFFDAAGNFHAREWDPAAGMIHRSRRFDDRNTEGNLRYTSLIVDAIKRPK